MKRFFPIAVLGLITLLGACSPSSGNKPVEHASFTVAEYDAGQQNVIGYVYELIDDNWEPVTVAEGTITAAGVVSLEFDAPPAGALYRLDDEEGVTASDEEMLGTFLDGIELADGSWVEPDWRGFDCETDCDHLVGERVGSNFVYVDREVTLTFNESMEGVSIAGSLNLEEGWYFLVQEVVAVDSSEETASLRVMTAAPDSVDWTYAGAF